MKMTNKLLRYFILCCCIWLSGDHWLCPAYAQQYVGKRSTQFSQIQTDTPINLTASGITFHTFVWTILGSPSVCSIKIQQSADGSTGWSDLISAQDCTVNGSTTSSTIANYIRMNVTGFTGTGTVTGIWTGYGSGGATTVPSITITGLTAGQAVGTNASKQLVSELIYYADQQSGADLGAKINTADTALGATKGEIWVDGGGTISTAVSLSTQHDLRFGPGTYNMTAAITCGGNNNIYGSGQLSTILKATGAMATQLICSQVSNVNIRDITIDGNSLVTTTLLDISNSPETVPQHRVERVLIKGPASNTVGINATGSENTSIVQLQTSGFSTAFPPTSATGKALVYSIPFGDGDITDSYIYGITEIAAQNMTFKGGLLEGLRITGSTETVLIDGTQVTNLPDTANVFAVGNNTFLDNLVIKSAFLTALRGSGSFFNSEGGTLGQWTSLISCEGCWFNVTGGAGSTPIFGSNFTNKFSGTSKPIFKGTGGYINSNITRTYPLATVLAKQLEGFGNDGVFSVDALINPYGVATTFNVASDFTTANNTSLQTITGLTWTLPANTALNVPFICGISYSQATGTAAVAFGIQSATISPTSLFAKGEIFTNTTATTEGNVTITNTTATAIVSATPSAITTIWNANISGFIENPSNASSNVINIMVSTATGADAVIIKRGSFCRIF